MRAGDSSWTQKYEYFLFHIHLLRFCFVLPIIQGETSKDCLVSIIDDSLYEHEEKFYVTVLSHLGSRINNRRNTTVVVISPDQKDGKTGN